MVNCKVYSGLTYEQEAGLCYKLDKAKKRLSMFSLMREAWQGDPRSLTANLLSGMALFVKTYDTEFTDRTFIKRFSQVDPEETGGFFHQQGIPAVRKGDPGAV